MSSQPLYNKLQMPSGVIRGNMATILKKKFKDFSTFEKVAVVGGATIAIYAGYKFFTRGNVQKAPVDYGQIPQVYTSGGKPVLWNPDPLAKEIYENFEGYNFYTYPETTEKLQTLNPDQLKLLYNHYNQYYANEYPTLTQLLKNEWTDWGGSYNKAVATLTGMGLNENDPEKLNWARVVEALTNEDKAFNFPIKYPAIDFDKPTKNMFYITAGIISTGLILGAALKR
jgi:hypothetical protein